MNDPSSRVIERCSLKGTMAAGSERLSYKNCLPPSETTQAQHYLPPNFFRPGMYEALGGVLGILLVGSPF